MHGSRIEKWNELLSLNSSASSFLRVSKKFGLLFSVSLCLRGRFRFKRLLSACPPARRCRQKSRSRGRKDLCSREQTQSCRRAVKDLFPGDAACGLRPLPACAPANCLCAGGGAEKHGAALQSC